jgi:hypothetical protein
VAASARRLSLVAIVVITAAGCSSGGLPDPLRSGLPHAAIVIDRVDCDPTPDLCTRYVVLRPVGISTNQLIASASRRMHKALGWTPTRYRQVVEYDEGAGFDGPRKHSPGGMINTVTEELHYWQRVGYTTGTPAPKTLLDIQHAMRATVSGVIVLISGG